MGRLTELLDNYGYIIIFLSLFLELIALPLPGEILMAYCGFLVFQGKLNYILCILCATLGVVCGVTTAYYLGIKLEMKFFENYGKYVHLGPDRLDKISRWFDKFGNKLLVISYFIPGVRHITGYVSGITRISFKKFAVHAYLGAIIWTLTFITLGKTLGSDWNSIEKYTSKYFIIALGIIVIIGVIIYLYKLYIERSKKFK